MDEQQRWTITADDRMQASRRRDTQSESARRTAVLYS